MDSLTSMFLVFVIVSHSNNFCDTLVCIPRQGNLSTRDQPKWKEFTCNSELTLTEKEGQKENGRVASLDSLLSHPVTSFLLEIQKLTSFRYPQIGTSRFLHFVYNLFVTFFSVILNCSL